MRNHRPQANTRRPTADGPPALTAQLRDTHFTIALDDSASAAHMFVAVEFGAVPPAGESEVLRLLMEANFLMLTPHGPRFSLFGSTFETLGSEDGSTSFGCLHSTTMDLRDAQQLCTRLGAGHVSLVGEGSDARWTFTIATADLLALMRGDPPGRD